MIGQFHFRQSPRRCAVALRMEWRGAERRARVELFDDLALQAEQDEFPNSQDFMSLPSALSYGVFLAMTYDRSIDFCGDETVWDTRWGVLRMERTN